MCYCPRAGFVQKKDSHVWHRSSYLLCLVQYKPAPLPSASCKFASHALFCALCYYTHLNPNNFYTCSTFVPIPTQSLMIHTFLGERKNTVSRTSKETNLFQDFGSLEFPLEERNNGGKYNSLESEPQSDFWPQFWFTLLIEQITETLGASGDPTT